MQIHSCSLYFRNGHSLYHIKVPLYLQGLLDIHATLLKDMQVKFIVAKEDYFKSGLVLHMKCTSVKSVLEAKKL